MNFLLAAPPLLGHVNPVLSVTRMLTARGHQATIITGSAFRQAVEASGAAFEPLPAEADAEALERAVAETRVVAPGPEQLLAVLTARFIDPVPAQHATLRRVLERGGFDALVVGSMFYGALPTAMRPGRVPVIACHMTFLTTERDDEAPAGLGILPALTSAERMTTLAARRTADDVLLLPLVERLDGRLAEVGAGPLGTSFGNAVTDYVDLFLQPSVPGFEYPRLAMPQSVRFVGPLPIPPSGAADPRLVDDVQDWRRVVLVTQGTVANADLGQLIEPALAAMADRADLLVLASTGGRDPACLRGTVPANAQVASFLPFEQLLPKVDVLVTNGGFGTVSAALAAGIPVVAAGQTEDKAEISARVQWSGAGVDLRTSRPSVAALREAIRTALDGAGCRMHARRLARECADYDSSVLVPRLVEGCVMRRKVRRRGLMIPVQ